MALPTVLRIKKNTKLLIRNNIHCKEFVFNAINTNENAHMKIIMIMQFKIHI